MGDRSIDATHWVAGAAGIAIGVLGFALVAGDSAPAESADTNQAAQGEPRSLDDEGGAGGGADCPKCPECAAEAPAQTALKIPLGAATTARHNPNDHALRWPKDVPEHLRPEFVKRTVREARAACQGALPAQMVVECKTFPCTIISDLKQGDEADLRTLCEGLKPLGELRVRSSSWNSRTKLRRSVMRQKVSEEFKDYERRSAPLLRKLRRGAGVSRLNCELEGDPESCAVWAVELAAEDLDAAIATATRACEGGAGRGCTVLAELGQNASANYGKACKKGDGAGCEGAILQICGREGETCTSEALAYANERLEELEANPKAYEWTKRKARKLVGKVLCANGKSEQGLAVLTEACTKDDGEMRGWCDPARMCKKPRFRMSTIW